MTKTEFNQQAKPLTVTLEDSEGNKLVYVADSCTFSTGSCRYNANNKVDAKVVGGINTTSDTRSRAIWMCVNAIENAVRAADCFFDEEAPYNDENFRKDLKEEIEKRISINQLGNLLASLTGVHGYDC